MLKRITGLVAISLTLLLLSGFQEAPEIYLARDGKAYFLSDAPLEMISATSNSLSGALNISERNFSFAIPVNSFEGFNSSLQKTHFNTDYLEADVFPKATFKGKIIEEIDLGVPGKHRIRAKGKLNIHGVENDRIIRCDVEVKPGSIQIVAKFTVFLDTHEIKIPTIVNQKIAQEIQVEINLELKPAS